MVRRAAEELEGLTVRLPAALMTQLRRLSAKEKRNLNELVRQAVEYFYYSSMSTIQRAALEKDQQAQQVTRRGYLDDLLMERYTQLVVNPAPPAASPKKK